MIHLGGLSGFSRALTEIPGQVEKTLSPTSGSSKLDQELFKAMADSALSVILSTLKKSGKNKNNESLSVIALQQLRTYLVSIGTEVAKNQNLSGLYSAILTEITKLESRIPGIATKK